MKPQTKWALVTGASRGLGHTITHHLLEAGYGVIALSRTCSEKLQQLQDTFPETCTFYAFDLSHTHQIYALVRTLVKTHGSLYALINNAAVGYDGVLSTMHESEIHSMLQINLEAPILLAKYCLRPMLLAQEGRIINISSIVAQTGFSGLSVYAATKAALVGFTRSLAREVGKVGITVNAIAPGYMETDMTRSVSSEQLAKIKRRSPLGRLTTPGEVAAAVRFLLSPEAAGITGTVLTVDAGATA